MVETNVVLTLLQTISIMVGIGYYILNIQNNQKNQTLALQNQEHQLETRQAQLYMTIFNSINNQEILKHLYDIRQYKFKNYDDFMEKYGPIHNPEAYSKIIKVWWLFSEMGTLVYRGFLSTEDCINLVGPAPMEIWVMYVNVIEGLRDNYWVPGTRQYMPFEYLAKLLRHGFLSGKLDSYVDGFYDSIPDVVIPENVSDLRTRQSNP